MLIFGVAGPAAARRSSPPLTVFTAASVGDRRHTAGTQMLADVFPDYEEQLAVGLFSVRVTQCSSGPEGRHGVRGRSGAATALLPAPFPSVYAAHGKRPSRPLLLHRARRSRLLQRLPERDGTRAVADRRHASKVPSSRSRSGPGSRGRRDLLLAERRGGSALVPGTTEAHGFGVVGQSGRHSRRHLRGRGHRGLVRTGSIDPWDAGRPVGVARAQWPSTARTRGVFCGSLRSGAAGPSSVRCPATRPVLLTAGRRVGMVVI
jgi:hypothetical protein